ncbi:MAG TPA: hypothetical protein VJT84_08475 [Gaiellaceae bacterium]|nr:hypothetical protein [Gaiellaceae bacterium]
MHQRAPIVLSSAALAVAVLGATPLGQAAGENLRAVVPFAKTAGNAQKLNGHRAALSGAPGTIPVIGRNGKLPARIGAVGPKGPAGPPGPAGPGGPAGGALTGEYPNPEIAASSVGTAEVANDSLTGADVVESTLVEVPSAVLGGLGRTGIPRTCDPEDRLVRCASVKLLLARPARVLVFGQVAAEVESGADRGHGRCFLRAGKAAIPDAGADMIAIEGHGSHQTGNATIVAVSPPVGPGEVTFTVECSQILGGAVTFRGAQVTALAISAS